MVAGILLVSYYHLKVGRHEVFAYHSFEMCVTPVISHLDSTSALQTGEADCKGVRVFKEMVDGGT